MKKIISITLLIGLSFASLKAQIYAVDALRLSYTQLEGTARTLGTGGAFSAVGGDPGALNYNPASLGMMRGSQLFLSPEIRLNKETFNYNNNTGGTNEFSVPWGYSGLVISSNSIDEWKKGDERRTNYAFTFSRAANFNQARSFTALNNDNSITYQYIDEFNQSPQLSQNLLTNPNVNPFNEFSFESVLSWQSYLANYDTSFQQFFSPVDAPVTQSGHYTTSGGIYNLSFYTASHTKDEKLYYGIGATIPIVRFKSETYFQEDDFQDGNTQFDQMTVTTDYTTQGAGFRILGGLIYRPVSFARVSFYVHSGDFLGLSESYQSRMTSRVDLAEAPQNAFAVESPTQEFSYSFRTPWRFGFGTAFFIKKKGFVSIDYELSNMGSGKYDFGNGFESFNANINDQIDDLYRFNHHLKLGTEFALKAFRLRGGMAYQTSPFSKSLVSKDGDMARLTFTAGLGYVVKKFSFDLAYVVTRSDEFYQPYSIIFGNAPFATFDYVDRRIALTVSARF